MSAQIVSSSSLVRFANSQEGLAQSFRHNDFPQKGRLVLLVKGEGEVVNTTVDSIKENYFISQEESILASLKESINLAIDPISSASSIQLLAAVLCREYIYVCGWGEVSVYLSRGTKFLQIFSGKNDQVGSCSGSVQAGDTFLLVDGHVSPESQELIEELFDQPDSLIVAEDLRSNLDNSLGVLIKIDSVNLSNEVEEIVPQKEEIKNEDVRVDIPNTPEEKTTISLREKKSLLVRFAEILPEKNPFEGKPRKGTSKRTAVSAGIILIILLLVSIILGVGQKKSAGFRLSYQSDLVQAQGNYNQAIAQKDINPVEARQLLSQAKTVIDGLIARNIQDPEVLSLKEKIEIESPQILGIVDAKPTVLIDLSLVREGIKAKELSSDRDLLAIFDEQGNRIIFADFEGKDIGITGGLDKLGTLQTFTSANNKFYGITPEGVVSLTQQGAHEVVIKKDDQWGQIAKIGTYGGNFYLIDTNGAIWRYASGSSEKVNWLKGQVNLATAQDLAVDGAIWILTDGRLMKFVRGQGELVSPIGLDQGFTNPTALYTNEDLDNIYVLDPANKRLVELDKHGIYKKAYVNDQLAFVRDFVVSKEFGKIILLTEAKVLELPLK